MWKLKEVFLLENFVLETLETDSNSCLISNFADIFILVLFIGTIAQAKLLAH